MKTFWLMLLEKAVVALLDKDWQKIVGQVKMLMAFDLSGEQKRKSAYQSLRGLGVDCATWLLYASIEIAYGKMKGMS